MCGIVGYFGSRQVDLTVAARSITHRGPDMQGITSGAGWRVAFNRLSILDVSENGMQPFTYDGVTVVMNGEIYNYRELRDEHKSEFTCRSGSDVEIVPFLYRKYGIGFLQKLNGMFALVIVDETNRRQFLVRDRFGKKPLFYKRNGDGVYFASELKALRELVALRPDKTNLALNMACWLLIQPLTPYEGVFNVNPGHYLEFDGREAVERQWYAPRIETRQRSYEQVRDEFMSLYRQSIGLRLRSDVPVGICLSGGLDSSSMAYIARQQSPENFIAFTAHIADKETWEGSTDTENPRRLCQDLGMRQISTGVDSAFWNQNIVDIAANYDEIFLNSGTLVFYAISRVARAHGVKVLLSGVGGDELFGGYPWQARMRTLPAGYLRDAMSTKSVRAAAPLYGLLARLGTNPFLARVARTFRLFAQFQVWHAQSLFGSFLPYLRAADGAMSARVEAASHNYFRLALRAVDGDLYNQVHYANIFTVIGNQNYQLDMASMRHSVENRGPLLDVNVVEYMMSVPDELKNRGGPKALMRSMLTEFLPQYITHARKSGPTMPLPEWFRDPSLGKAARTFLAGHRDLVAEYLSPDLAGRLADETLYAMPDGGMRMFALLSFVLWSKINIENSIPDRSISFMELAQSCAARAA